MKLFSGWAGERVNRDVSGDDDGDGIENGAVHVFRGGEDHFVQIVFLALAQAEFTVDVFHHHQRAVNDDAEVNRADGEQVGGDAARVQKNKREQQREWNGERDDNGGTHADQEENQDDEDQSHPQEHIFFHGVYG